MQNGVRTALALGTLVITAAGAWQGFRVFRDERAGLERARAWADFSACLVGEPLPPGETLEQRFRGIELALERSTAKTPDVTEWPLSCARTRDALVSSHAMAQDSALRDAVLVGFSALQKTRSPRALSQAFELGKTLPRVATTPGILRPPPPLVPLVRTASISKRSLLYGPLDYAQEAGTLHVLSRDGRVCDGAMDAQAVTCRSLGKIQPLGFVATSRRQPFLVSASEAKDLALIAPDGSVFAKLAGEPNEDGRAKVHVAADGVITSVHDLFASERYGLEGNYRLVRYRDKRDPLRIDLPPNQRKLEIVGDFVLSRTGGKLYARPIEATDSVLGQPIELGAITGRQRVLSCPDGTTTAVIEGEDELMDWREGYVEMRVYRTPEWKLLTSVPFPHAGKRRSGLPTLACTPDTATFVWIESDGAAHRVRRLRCRASGCSEDSGEVRELLPLGFFVSKDGMDAAIRAAPIGDSVALVWWSRDEAVRSVVGALGELQTKQRDVLFDASPFGLSSLGIGRQWLRAIRLEPRGDSVLVELTLGGKEAVLIRVNRDGRASPLELRE